MKAIVEFGVRGDRHSQFVCPNAKQAASLAYKMAHVFNRDGGKLTDFLVKRGAPRLSWQSSTHFVSVSLLDDVPRGNDVAAWRPEVRV